MGVTCRGTRRGRPVAGRASHFGLPLDSGAIRLKAPACLTLFMFETLLPESLIDTC
jgi:hypothetical protein